MSDQKIEIKTFEELREHISRDRQSMIHCAVQRNAYRHHFILLGHTWSSYYEVCYIIHYTWVQDEKLTAKVMMHKIGKSQLEEYIKSKLYVFLNEKYPRNVEEFDIAYKRFTKVVNEKNFHVLKNNCEHLVSFILTGESISKQLEKLSWIETFVLRFLVNSSQSCSSFFCKSELHIPPSTTSSVIKIGRTLPPSFPSEI